MKQPVVSGAFVPTKYYEDMWTRSGSRTIRRANTGGYEIKLRCGHAQFFERKRSFKSQTADCKECDRPLAHDLTCLSTAASRYGLTQLDAQLDLLRNVRVDLTHVIGILDLRRFDDMVQRAGGLIPWSPPLRDLIELCRAAEQAQAEASPRKKSPLNLAEMLKSWLTAWPESRFATLETMPSMAVQLDTSQRLLRIAQCACEELDGVTGKSLLFEAAAHLNTLRDAVNDCVAALNGDES